MPIKRDFQGYFSQIQHAGNAGGDTAKKSYKVENAFTPVLKDGSYEVVMRFLPSHPDSNGFRTTFPNSAETLTR